MTTGANAPSSNPDVLLAQAIEHTSRWRRATWLGLPLIPLGIIGTKYADSTGQDLYAWLGLAAILAGVGFIAFANLRSMKYNEVAMAQAAHLHHAVVRDARGSADLFNDEQVRALWQEWNAELENYAASDPTMEKPTDFEVYVFQVKQDALQEAAKLAQVNPDFTLRQWYEVMASLLKQTEEETQLLLDDPAGLEDDKNLYREGYRAYETVVTDLGTRVTS